MTVVNIRRQGGAAIMTVPADALRALRIGVGSSVEVAIVSGALVVTPIEKAARRRYSLRDLLAGATPKNLLQLADETAWAREGDPVGREL